MDRLDNLIDFFYEQVELNFDFLRDGLGFSNHYNLTRDVDNLSDTIAISRYLKDEIAVEITWRVIDIDAINIGLILLQEKEMPSVYSYFGDEGCGEAMIFIDYLELYNKQRWAVIMKDLKKNKKSDDSIDSKIKRRLEVLSAAFKTNWGRVTDNNLSEMFRRTALFSRKKLQLW